MKDNLILLEKLGEITSDMEDNPRKYTTWEIEFIEDMKIADFITTGQNEIIERIYGKLNGTGY